MGTTAAKLQAALDSKEAIRQAIIAKDVDVPLETPLSQFPAKIAAIESGGGSAEVHTVYIVDHTGIVAEIPVAHGGDVTLPVPQVYENLEFAAWHGQTTNVTEDGVVVAAMYDTVDDYTYFELRLTPKTGLLVQINFYKDAPMENFRLYLGYETSPGVEAFVQWSSSSLVLFYHTFPAFGTYKCRTEYQGSYALGLPGDDRSFIETGDGLPLTHALRTVKVSKLARLEPDAFYSQTMLEEIVLSYNTTQASLGRGVFRNLYALRSLILPPSIVNFTAQSSPYTLSGLWQIEVFYCAGVLQSAHPSFLSTAYNLKVTSMDNMMAVYNYTRAFYLCYSLLYAKLPSGLSEIKDYTFDSCYNLKKLNFPTALTSIGYRAFYGCYSLTFDQQEIPESVLTIGTYAFNECYQFRPQKYPVLSILEGSILRRNYSVEVISDIVDKTIITSAFDSLNALRVLIFKDVTSIAQQSVYNCPVLEEIIFEQNTPPTFGSTPFYTGTNSNYIIYVPDASLSAYKTATNLVPYADRIFPISQRPTT